MTEELERNVESNGNLRLLDEAFTGLFCSIRYAGDPILKPIPMSEPSARHTSP